MSDVYSRYLTVGGHIGAATHARVNWAGKHQLIGKPARADAVVSTFRNGKTQVQRVAEGVKFFTLAQALKRRLLAVARCVGNVKKASTIPGNAHYRQIMQYIHRQQFNGTTFSLGVFVFAKVGIWFQRDLRDDMKVGYHQIRGANQKARSHGGLAIAVLQ